MNVLMVRAKVKEENVADARASIEKVIQALEQAQPVGVRYASCLLGDGVTFIALLKLADDGSHPRLPGDGGEPQAVVRGAAGCRADDGHRLVRAVPYMSLGAVAWPVALAATGYASGGFATLSVFWRPTVRGCRVA